MPQTQSSPAPAAVEKADSTLRRRLIGGLVVIGLYFAVQLIPRPVAIKPEGWRLLGIFVATIGGLILQPIAGGALVLMAVTLAAIAGRVTIQPALGRDGDPTPWLGVGAFFFFLSFFQNSFRPPPALALLPS